MFDQSILAVLRQSVPGHFQAGEPVPARVDQVLNGPLDEIMQLPIASPAVEYEVDFLFL